MIRGKLQLAQECKTCCFLLCTIIVTVAGRVVQLRRGPESVKPVFTSPAFSEFMDGSSRSSSAPLPNISSSSSRHNMCHTLETMVGVLSNFMSPGELALFSRTCTELHQPCMEAQVELLVLLLIEVRRSVNVVTTVLDTPTSSPEEPQRCVQLIPLVFEEAARLAVDSDRKVILKKLTIERQMLEQQLVSSSPRSPGAWGGRSPSPRPQPTQSTARTRPRRARDRRTGSGSGALTF